jgi:hypothetical protein
LSPHRVKRRHTAERHECRSHAGVLERGAIDGPGGIDITPPLQSQLGLVARTPPRLWSSSPDWLCGHHPLLCGSSRDDGADSTPPVLCKRGKVAGLVTLGVGGLTKRIQGVFGVVLRNEPRECSGRFCETNPGSVPGGFAKRTQGSRLATGRVRKLLSRARVTRAGRFRLTLNKEITK